jgi:hypothetical protein
MMRGNKELLWQYGNVRTAVLKKKDAASPGNVTAAQKTALRKKNS